LKKGGHISKMLYLETNGISQISGHYKCFNGVWYYIYRI